MSDDRKFQLKPNKIKADWITNHEVCLKFDQVNLQCKKSKFIKDTTISLTGNKKGMTFTLSGNNLSENGVVKFGQYLFAKRCRDNGVGTKSLPADVTIELGGQSIIGHLIATCKVNNNLMSAKVTWKP